MKNSLLEKSFLDKIFPVQFNCEVTGLGVQSAKFSAMLWNRSRLGKYLKSGDPLFTYGIYNDYEILSFDEIKLRFYIISKNHHRFTTNADLKQVNSLVLNRKDLIEEELVAFDKICLKLQNEVAEKILLEEERREHLAKIEAKRKRLFVK